MGVWSVGRPGSVADITRRPICGSRRCSQRRLGSTRARLMRHLLSNPARCSQRDLGLLVGDFGPLHRFTERRTLDCGDKRSATPLWLAWARVDAKPKRPRRCALPAHLVSRGERSYVECGDLSPLLLGDLSPSMRALRCPHACWPTSRPAKKRRQLGALHRTCFPVETRTPERAWAHLSFEWVRRGLDCKKQAHEWNLLCNGTIGIALGPFQKVSSIGIPMPIESASVKIDSSQVAKRPDSPNHAHFFSVIL